MPEVRNCLTCKGGTPVHVVIEGRVCLVCKECIPGTLKELHRGMNDDKFTCRAHQPKEQQ